MIYRCQKALGDLADLFHVFSRKYSVNPSDSAGVLEDIQEQPDS